MLFSLAKKSLVLALVLVPGIALASKPTMVGKISLTFQGEQTCSLEGLEKEGGSQQGRSNISHDETTISWTTTCVINLPKTVTYCAQTSEEIAQPDAFVSWRSGFQGNVLRAKVVSDADINPSFGAYNVIYHCFE